MSRLEIPTRFIVTNGTLSVDLIDGALAISAWRPSSPDYVGDGLFQRWSATFMSTLEIKAAASDPNAVIKEIRELLALCELALKYKNNRWQNYSPVWIEMQGRGQTNVQYALLQGGRIPEAEDPFGPLFQSFWKRYGSTWEMSFIFQATNWSATRPTTGADLLLNTSQIVQLILNGGLDNYLAGSPVDWTVVVSGTATAKQNVDLRYVHSGLYSERFLATATETAYLRQNIPADAGTYIAARAWVYVVEGQAEILITEIGGAGTLASVKTSQPGWQKLECFAAVPDPIVGTVRVYVGAINTPRDLEIYVDSIEVGYRVGNVAQSGNLSPAANVALSNKHTWIGLTHIYQKNAAGVWNTNNLVTAKIFFGTTPATNDATYFGVSTLAINPGTFNNLLLDISQVASGVEYVWEYWDGTSWTGVANLSDDYQLTRLGANLVSWNPSADWTVGALDAIVGGAGAPTLSALWVRCRVSATTGGSPVAAVTGLDRVVHTAVWNFIRSADIGGDIRSLLAVMLQAKYDPSAVTGGIDTDDYNTNRVIVGARSGSRGLFQSYINLSNTGNMPGITVSDAGAGSFTADIEAPTGFAITGTTTGTSDLLATISIPGNTAKAYSGTFRAFVIANRTTGGDDIGFMITTAVGGHTANSLSTYDPVGDDRSFAIFDVGDVRIDLPPADINGTITISVYVLDKTGTGYVATAYALVLIPTDEWSGEFFIQSAPGANIGAGQDQIVRLDSLVDQGKTRKVRSFVQDETGLMVYALTSRTGDEISLLPSAQFGDQYLYFLFDGIQSARPEMVYLGEVDHQDRYLLNRGDDVVEVAL